MTATALSPHPAPVASPVEATEAPAPVAPRAGSRLPLAVVVGLVTLAGAMAAITPHFVGVFQDDGIYLILAKALAEGEGFRYLNLPGTPAATHYPPGYPVFLALLWKLAPSFPGNVVVFQAANAVLLALAAALACRFALRRLALPPAVAAIATLAGALSIPSLLLAGLLLSETLFLALLFLAWDRSEVLLEARDDAPRARMAATLGLLLGVLMLVRSLGLPAVGAVLLLLAWRRRWRDLAIVGAIAFACILPWQLWQRAHADVLPPELQGKYGSYGGWLAQAVSAHGLPFLLATVKKNVAAGVPMFLAQLRPPGMPWLVAPLAIAAGVLALAGLAALARRSMVTCLTLLGYFAIVLVWPFDPTRFVWSMWLPLLLVLALGAVGFRDAAPRPARVLLAACGVFVLAGALGYDAHGWSKGWHSSLARRRAPEVERVLRWVGTETRPTDLLVAEDEPMVWLYTGRQGVPAGRFTAAEHLFDVPVDTTAAVLERIVRRYQPRYVVVSTQGVEASAKTLIRRDSTALRLHFADNGHFAVLIPALP